MATAAVILWSHAADEARGAVIADQLISYDLDIWWERLGDPEKPSADREGVVQNQRCELFLLSEAALANVESGLLKEAERAAARGSAILARLDEVAVPESLQSVTCYDIRGWRSHPTGWRRLLAGNVFMRDLVSAVRYKLAGRDPPPPAAPRKMLLRQLALLLPFGAALFAFVAGALDFYRNAGLDAMAGPQEAAAWEARAAGSCDDLRAYLAEYPGGAYSGEARDLLDGRKTESRISEQRSERPIDLYEPAGMADPSATRAAAVADALGRAQESAHTSCQRMADATQAVLIGAEILEPDYSCHTVSGGMVCSLDAGANCILSEEVETAVEICGGE